MSTASHDTGAAEEAMGRALPWVLGHGDLAGDAIWWCRQVAKADPMCQVLANVDIPESQVTNGAARILDPSLEGQEPIDLNIDWPTEAIARQAVLSRKCGALWWENTAAAAKVLAEFVGEEVHGHLCTFQLFALEVGPTIGIDINLPERKRELVAKLLADIDHSGERWDSYTLEAAAHVTAFAAESVSVDALERWAGHTCRAQHEDGSFLLRTRPIEYGGEVLDHQWTEDRSRQMSTTAALVVLSGFRTTARSGA